MGELKQGPDPHSGTIVCVRRETLRPRVKQLMCGSLHGMRIRPSLLQPYICQAGTQVSWKGQWLGAGVQGLWSNPSVRAAVDSGETDRGDMREKIVVGNVCGGKPGSHGSKVILLSHAYRVEPSP